MRLIPIDSGNWEEAASLTTNPGGMPTLHERFLASNAYSMLQARYEKGWNIRGIEEDGRMIGFAMYGYNFADRFYEICRLMIDRRFQGRGLGRQALRLILEEMKKTEGTEEIYISAEPENTRAIGLYLSEGFSDTGRFLEGERLLVRKFQDREAC